MIDLVDRPATTIHAAITIIIFVVMLNIGSLIVINITGQSCWRPQHTLWVERNEVEYDVG